MKTLLAAILGITIAVAVAFATAPFGTVPSVSADTIYLKNGGVIHGKIVKDPERAGSSRIIFENGGYLILKNDEIKKSTENDLGAFKNRGEEAIPVPAAARTEKLVRVTLKRTRNEFYGRGSYVGWPKDSDDADIILLGLPGGGELRIPKSNVAAQTEIDLSEAGLAPAITPDDRRIATTHRVTLKNGRILLGDLEATKDDEPIKIRVGQLGLMRFDRDKVESVEKIDGVYEAPDPGEEEVSTGDPDHEIPAEVIETLKKKLRKEILRELIEGIIDDKIDEKLDASLRDAQSRGGVRLPVESLSTEQVLEAQYLVRELFRQRTRNRVRAEAQLKTLGPGVLEYLEPAVRSKFNLTRRAAQRIIRDVGDFRGAPLAIDSLNDSDVFVRKLAQEALSKLLHDVKIAFNAEGPEKNRLAAQARYREEWLDIVRHEARGALAEKARRLLDE